jgi:hypothetical protein
MSRFLSCLSLLLALLHPALARAEPISPLPVLRDASAVWGDGQDLLYIVHVAGHVTVYELRRGAAPRRIEPPDFSLQGLVSLVGAGSGEKVQLVVWDGKGRAAWYHGGQWQLVQLPLQPDETGLPCRGVLPAVGAPFSCVTSRGAVLQWQGEAVQRFDPPPGERAALAVTATPTGTLYLIDKELRLLRFVNGAFEPLALPKLRREKDDPPGALAGVSWDPVRSELWVGFGDRLLVWDVERGRTSLRKLPEPLLDGSYPIDWTSMRGTQGRAGPLIWASSYKHTFLCDLKDCYRVPLEGYLHSGFLSAGDGTFYAALNTGVVAVPVQVEALGNGRGTPARASRRGRSGTPLPLLNVAMGPRWPLPEGEVGFALDVMIGVHQGWPRSALPTATGFWLSPQLGYSYTPGTHLFVAGAGLGFGSRRLLLDYTPRLVVGSGPMERVLGVRHGLGVHLLNGLLGLEVAHQFTGEHDVRLMFYLTPGLLIVGGFAYALASAFFGPPRNVF